MELLLSTRLKNELEQWPTEKVLLWACQTFGSRVAATSSFQSQSLPLLHLISKVYPDLTVLFVDTGFHFPETLAFRDALASSLGLNLKVIQSEASATEFEHLYGNLYYKDPDRCCAIRKIAPLQNALDGYQAWISGIRRDQTETRHNADIIQFHGNIIKINPMIHWTQEDVNQYIEENDLPRHPLEARGYKSIGCFPCTHAINETDSFRYGRWIGCEKIECGLHKMSTPIYQTTIKVSN